MIYPWKMGGESGSIVFGGRGPVTPYGSSGVIAYLEIDNRKCTEISECFSSANEVGKCIYF